MKERDVTQKLQAWMKRKGWLVYRAPDSFHRKVECPRCVAEGRDGMLYCKDCAAYVPKDIDGAFVPFKPADLAVLRRGTEMRPGFWVEVKLKRAKTEAGMNYKPAHVPPHQMKAMAESDGYLAVGFIQKRDGEKDTHVGTYMVPWSVAVEMESVSREWLKGADCVIVVKDEELKAPKEKQEALDLLGG